MYQFDALTLLCGYFADAGSLSKLLFAHCSVSAPDLTSMLLLFIARSLMPLHNELIITIAHHSDCTVPSEYVRVLQAWKQSA